MSSFFDNFMSGFAFGMLANNPLFGGFGCCGFGYGYNTVDFGGFANPFPSVFDNIGYSSMNSVQPMPTTFANSAFPAVDFTEAYQTIWDTTMNPDSEYNKSMREYYKQIEKQRQESQSYTYQTNTSQFQFPFSSFYMPTQIFPGFYTGTITSSTKKPSDSSSTKTDTKLYGNGSDKYFSKMLAFVLEHEGGYVNHPHDKGGATNKGVTQTTYNSYRKRKGLATRSVKDITSEEAREIYYNNYKESGADKISDPRLAMCVFDWANHSGAGNKVLQKSLKECNGDVDKFIDMRADFLHDLIAKDKTQEDFRKGWDNRIKDLRTFVHSSLPVNYA